MARKKTGSVYLSRGRWFAKVTLTDGHVEHVQLDPDITEARARKLALDCGSESRVAVTRCASHDRHDRYNLVIAGNGGGCLR